MVFSQSTTFRFVILQFTTVRFPCGGETHAVTSDTPCRALREGLHEGTAIEFCDDAAFVSAGANEAAYALVEFEDGFEDAVFHEWIAARWRTLCVFQ